MNLLDKITLLPLYKHVGDSVEFVWSGSGWQFEFCGDLIQFEITCMNQQNGPSILDICVDDQLYQKIDLFDGTHTYTISFPDDSYKHVKCIKLTEMQYGSFTLHAIHTQQKIVPTPLPSSSILWIGDSLSAGFGLTSPIKEGLFDTHFEDCTLSYPYIVSQALQVLPLLVAYSGNGVLSRWIPPEIDTKKDVDLLPSIFPYDMQAEPKWVIINLGTNDSSFTKLIQQREYDYIQAYTSFIQQLKTKFPSAKFLLVYGMMDKTLLSSVQTVAKNTSCMFLELEQATDEASFCYAGHPDKDFQAKVADSLIQFIRLYDEAKL
ncbi:MAG: GDSL-type esterase/lipase family protein [Erysipelotrichaceae bacterium]|nr:GDSL-type esterase/lipase family protein [Erysipelotrichaceae bacterium]MDY6034864.1 GDSL-type esterase/lipase family protein [Bulleidia sp.]